VRVPDGSLLAVEVPDPAHWLLAQGSSVLETMDAGEHWSALGQVPAGWTIARLTMVDRDRGRALLFSSPTPGFLLAPARALGRTVDGGRHWVLVPTL
jgi:hypothetical protein